MPVHPDVVHQGFAATPTAARWARRHTAAVLAAWGACALESAVLQVVSELVANATARPIARCSPYTVVLTLRLLPDRISIEVFDPDPTPPPVTAPARDDAERGRGMAIVRALACGMRVVPVAHGKIVIAQVRRPGNEHSR
jgi:anti-sigma regulatory factor (Ser/Thr protein kinase)